MTAKAPEKQIYSMTGFGVGACENECIFARVQVRAVNHRGRKVNVNCRMSLGQSEKNLRDMVAGALKRGSIDVMVNIVRHRNGDNFGLRDDVARSAVGALKKLADELGVSGEFSLSDLIQIPGLFDSGNDVPLSEEEWPVLEAAAKEALEQVVRMRAREGDATVTSLFDIVTPLREFVVNAREEAPRVVQRAREKLEARLKEICGEQLRDCDQQTLEREICMFSDRADINEELDRLESHLSQFDRLLNRGGEVGKKLEFLSQEFLREVNTSCSKASDTAIISAGVNAKLAVEKIKEQAANLE